MPETCLLQYVCVFRLNPTLTGAHHDATCASVNKKIGSRYYGYTHSIDTSSVYVHYNIGHTRTLPLCYTHAKREFPRRSVEISCTVHVYRTSTRSVCPLVRVTFSENTVYFFDIFFVIIHGIRNLYSITLLCTRNKSPAETIKFYASCIL